MSEKVLNDNAVGFWAADSDSVEDKIENTFLQLDAIAEETRNQAADIENSLYRRLAEVYVLYYYWMNSPHLDGFEQNLNDYLDNRDIPYNEGTSIGLKFTKAFLAETQIAKASKYAKHIESAFNKGVEPSEYPAWTNENGVEVVSRRRPLLKNAKKVHRNSKSDYFRAVDLIYKWLEIRESSPLYSSDVPVDDVKKNNPHIEGSAAKTRYEITICKRYDGLKDSSLCHIDALWALPRLDSIERIIINHLAHAIMRNLESLEELVREADFKTFGTDIQELIEFDEYVAEWAIQQENLLNTKLREASGNGDDLGQVYASHNPIPPKLKK